jgi:hypothetical protein
MSRRKDNIKIDLKQTGEKVWIGFIWLWIELICLR